jgi:hypothetical protein
LWALDSDVDWGDSWDTACGEKFTFIDSGPEDNKMRFCPYCGGALVVAAPTSPVVVEGEDA